MIAISEVIRAYEAKTPQELANIPQYVAVFGSSGIVFQYKDNDGVSHNITITSDNFFNELDHFISWQMLAYNGNVDPLEKFLSKLNYHLINKKSQYERILTALMLDYSPIENVFEDETDTITKTGTIGNNGQDTSNIGVRRGTATDNSVTSQQYVNTWETSDDVKDGKAVGTGSTTTTSDATQDTVSRANTETFNTTDAHTKNRHGNVGVTKSSELVRDEITLRNHNVFINLFITGFVNDTMYLVKEVWNE